MAKALTEAHETALKKLFDSQINGDREKAIQELADLCQTSGDKKAVTTYLAEMLEQEQQAGRRRGWILSVLAALNNPGAVEIVTQHLDSKVEKSERVRVWAAVALAKLQPPDLKDRLDQVLQDKSTQVKAVGLRLMTEYDFGQEYVEQLLGMAVSEQFNDRWSAFKALRDEFGLQPLPEEAEKKLVPVMVQCLQDNDEWRDIRHQAALALGSVLHHKTVAVRALSETLKDKPPVSVRRDCVGALARLDESEAQEALLYALWDDEPAIRIVATDALKSLLRPRGAVNLIVNDMLRQETIPEGYLEALRRIGHETATKQISDNLLHPDPEVAQRAADALAQLGGEMAVRTLQAQRARALNKYTEMLDTADQRIMNHFDNLMRQARLAFRLSMVMHGLIFLMGIIILLTGLYLASAPGDLGNLKFWLGTGSAGVGVATLLTLFYKDPFQNIGHSVNNLVKVNVVFLGYIRQINQIDATFKQMFFTSVNFSVSQMQETVTQIEMSVAKTLEQVKAYLPE